MVFIYKLVDDYYTNDKSILLTCDKEYSYEEFDKLVNDLLYEDEGNLRTMYQIVEVLVNDYDFDYLQEDVMVFI